MIELALAAGLMFGKGNWMCTHGYEYPKSNLREIFYSHVTYADDLSYTANTEIIYERISSNEVLGKIAATTSGKVTSQRKTFKDNPKKAEARVVFDHFGELTQEYLANVETFLMQGGEELKVQEMTAKSMTVVHLRTGDTTKCKAAPEK